MIDVGLTPVRSPGPPVAGLPGAGAVVGTDIVAKSAPDGYTLLVMSNTHTTNETLLATRPYSLFDQVANTLAFIGFSLPTFFTGILFILFFSIHLNLLPFV